MLRLSQVAFTLAVVALVTASKSRHTAPARNNLYLHQPVLPYGHRDGGLFTNSHLPTFTDRNRGSRNSKCGRQLGRSDCPLFHFGSNLVTKEDFIVKAS